MLLREYCLVAFLALISNNLISQECSKLASILASNKPYHLANVYQDSLRTSLKSKVIGDKYLSSIISPDIHFRNLDDSVYNFDNFISPECSKLDSILASNKPYHLAKVYQDSLIVSVKSKISDNVILSAFNELNLNMEDRFYLIYNCRISKTKRKLYFSIIEYRRLFPNFPMETYEMTNCPTFYRRYNRARFKIEKGRFIFEKWEIE